ncbi:MAG: type II toxin-antitoxin system prevent-host-death family antitoxin [Bacteroidota bacterium]
MDIQSTKIELINWITKVNDIQIIKALKSIKDDKAGHGKRQFGSGKHLISKIADDFNAPLDQFKDYLK